jgi:uncharacterized membrane protein
VLIAAGLYEWLMFLHIVAGMIWVGGALTVSLLASRMLGSGDAPAISEFIGSLQLIGPLVFAPAIAGVLAFGIWMVVDSSAWSFSQSWLVIALALFAAAVLVGAVFQSRAAIGAKRAADTGDNERAARLLRRWISGMRLIFLILLVIAWDMSTKPGL